ncbi:MAG: hypothetical protein GX616_21015, partial [Planctomycetes bacterium]|nr:hypothetical protein [Planctomycetota bacterium]
MKTSPARLAVFASWKPVSMMLLFLTVRASAAEPVRDQLAPLPAGAVRFNGGLEDDIQNSITHWNKGVVPYAGFVQMFRT